MPFLPERKAGISGSEGRLDSWKEIAAYLNRGIRTVARWEREEGLPVHRLQHDKRGSVYAYKAEIDAWFESRRDTLEQEQRAGMAPTPGPPTSAGGMSRIRVSAILRVASLCTLALLAGIGLQWWFGRPPATGPIDLVRLTSDVGLTAYPALSPDGKLLAYASDRRGAAKLSIWVQSLHGGEPVQLTRDDANESEPCFSPDGSTIAFRSDRDGGGIYTVPVLGGEARRIAERGRHPQFSPDGAWIAYWERDETWGPGQIYVVGARGGAPRRLRPEFADAHYPIWAPDGRHLLFCGTRKPNSPADEHDWWVTPLDSGPVVKTRAAATYLWQHAPALATLASAGGDKLGYPAAWVGNEIVFSATLNQTQNIWRVGISPKDWAIDSVPRRITTGTGIQVYPAVAGHRLVFVSAISHVNAWMLPLSAQGLAAGDPKRLTFSIFDSHPSISANGAALAFISERSGNREVWLKDLATGKETALTATAAAVSHPKVSRDGSRVVYRSLPKWEQILYVARPGNLPEQVCRDCGLPSDWSPDGTRVLYEPGLAMPPVRLLDLATGKSFDVLADPKAGLYSARFSPDGNWIAFHTKDASQKTRIAIARFRLEPRVPPEEWIMLTDGASPSHNPCWSADGSIIYYLSERDGFRCIWAQRLGRNKQPSGAAFAVRHFHAAQQSLLMNVRANPNQVGLSAGANGLVFALDEIAGNIWSTRF